MVGKKIYSVSQKGKDRLSIANQNITRFLKTW